MAALRGLPFLLRDGLTVALTPPSLSRDRFCTVVHANAQGELARFSGIEDLDRAESIVGCYVLAREDDLDLDAYDVAFDDLLGREVHDERYGALGTIREVLETPANSVWVVDGSAYGEVLIPVIDLVIDEIPENDPIPVHIMDGLIDAPAPIGGNA